MISYIIDMSTSHLHGLSCYVSIRLIQWSSFCCIFCMNILSVLYGKYSCGFSNCICLQMVFYSHYSIRLFPFKYLCRTFLIFGLWISLKQSDKNQSLDYENEISLFSENDIMTAGSRIIVILTESVH